MNLYPINGLCDELYYPNDHHLTREPLTADGLGRLNGLYWAGLLDPAMIQRAVGRLRDYYAYRRCELPHYCAILGNADYFVRRVGDAAASIVNQGLTKREFFSCIEVISLLCRLYSDFLFAPFTLTITDGFLLDESNAETLVSDCVSETHNPYLTFLEEQAFPLIRAANPELVFINGPLRMSTAAMARHAKKRNPDVHICVTRHGSEYYSLNKITHLLLRNAPLFSLIDSIVLDDSAATEQQLIDALQSGRGLSGVNNLLYIDRASGKIQQTPYAKNAVSPFEQSIVKRPRTLPAGSPGIDPSALADAKLFPGRICSWRKCAFCGINHKYKIEEMGEGSQTLMDKIDTLEQLVRDGVRYLWLIDEAISAEDLAAFSSALLERGVPLLWQARARLSSAFTEGLCALLAKAGLREIRFGLESGSLTTLRRMHKFEDGFRFGLVEEVLRNMSKAGVCVHFPIITGFPGETKAQRMETYAMLAEYKRRYPSVSFNINLLGLDISSELYRKRDDFDIAMIKLPCAPRHYIGNLLNEWADENGVFDRVTLGGEQTSVMRELLYSDFYPPASLTPPHIFYRLSETIRNTLIWAASAQKEEPLRFDSAALLRWDDSVAIYRQTTVGEYGNMALTTVFSLYCFEHVAITSAAADKIVDLFRAPCSPEQALARYSPGSEEYKRARSWVENAFYSRLLQAV